MLHLSPSSNLNLAVRGSFEGFVDFINKRIYKVSDVDISYRRVHLMGKYGILNDTQKEEGKWRHFSLAELVFLVISTRLHSFGVESPQLFGLYQSFFKEEKVGGINGGSDLYKGIALVFTKEPIILVYFPNGEASIFDHENLITSNVHETDHISINLNKVVDDLLMKVACNKQFDYKTILRIFGEMPIEEAGLNPKEKKLIDLIRRGEYESLEIRLLNNDMMTIKGSKRFEGDLSAHAYMRLVAEGWYREIQTTLKSGKVVTYKIQDTIKP